jgi:hypothetical protein
MQFVDLNQQDVELAHGAKAPRHFPEAASNLPARGALELEHRHEFSQAARRHSRQVQRPNVALLNRMENSGELVDAFFEQFRAGRGSGHDVDAVGAVFIIVDRAAPGNSYRLHVGETHAGNG